MPCYPVAPLNDDKVLKIIQSTTIGRGVRVLNEEIIKEIMELIEANQFSCREIALKTGVSRAVINRIANGKRKLKPKPKSEELKTEWKDNGYERCAECGAMVYLPCFTCLVKKIARKKDHLFSHIDLFDTMKLELEEKHRLRYEQVKAWRDVQENPNFVELPDDWPFRKTCERNRRKNSNSAQK